MCAPDCFDVTYEINAWMRVANAPDQLLARRQWRALYDILTERLGVSVSCIPQAPGLPDMVFTANAGIVRGTRFIPSRFRFAERQGEVPHFIDWFGRAGFDVLEIPSGVPGAFEGEGDALFYGGRLVVGHGWRSDKPAHAAVGALLGCEVVPLALTDPRWYHLDTCFLPLGPDLFAYYPGAFDAASNAILEQLPGDKIVLTESDALRFGANAIVIGHDVVLNAGCTALESVLTARGYTPHPTDLSEFLKAGGSAKCLALVLDH
jgi:N-dimethylarginine dimethylaminohydrolase